MPSPFDITLATNTVALDNNRQGLVAFTIKNKLHQRIRAQLRVTVQPPIALNWLTILPGDPTSLDPANVRDFPVDNTQQIQVKVAAPADAPAGSYILKLTAADESNPDDNFTDSPDANFTIHETPKPAPALFPTWIIPAVLIGVLVIVIIILVASRPSDPLVIPTPTSIPPTEFIPTATIPPLPTNLVAGLIQLDTTPPICGRLFKVFFDVANLGTQPTVASGTVSLVDIFPGNGTQTTATGTFPILQPGQTFRVSIPLTIATSPNEARNMTLTIDPNNQIAETNESDNTRTLSYRLSSSFCES
ncbi:MAG: CARDB domain-containing protein [Chloroflexota bacterium]